MKKHIVLICEGGAQFGLIVEEMSAHKVIGRILADLKSSVEFMCLTDYADSEDPNQEMWIKRSIVNAIAIVQPKDNNIQVPKKGIFVPEGKPN